MISGLSKGAIYHHFKSKESVNRPEQNNLFTAAPDFNDNPRLLVGILRDTIQETVPNYILSIIKQGVLDGSIRTDYPKELAELILLASNVWMNPMIFDSTREETYRKFMVLRQMMQGFGLDIMDDEIWERRWAYWPAQIALKEPYSAKGNAPET